MFSLIVLAASVVALGLAYTVDNCPPGLSRDSYLQVHQDKCYEFELFRRKSYQAALAYCKEDGGTLALVKTKSINDFIVKAIGHYRDFPHTRKVWIGARFNMDDSVYQWDDGSEMDFDNFKKDDENVDGCVALDPTTGEWVAAECEDSYDWGGEQFVCEYPVTNSTSVDEDGKFPATITPDDCPVGYSDKRIMQVFGNTCYLFYTFDRLSFNDASEKCQQFDGSLVIIDSNRTNAFLQHHLYVTHRFHFQSDPVWIGLKYNATSHGYRWLDGSIPNFTNYKFDEFYDECFAMSPLDGEWQESECGGKMDEEGKVDEGDEKYFICQYIVKGLDNVQDKTTTLPPQISTAPKIGETQTTAQMITDSTRTRTETEERTTAPSTTSSTTTIEPPSTTRDTPTPTPVVTCMTLVCNLDCGLQGYVRESGCMKCQCDN